MSERVGEQGHQNVSGAEITASSGWASLVHPMSQHLAWHMASIYVE